MTTPIESYYHLLSAVDATALQKSYAALLALQHVERPVAFHKRVFGRQSYITILFRRYWVWEREAWTVYVNNVKGACFEVAENSTLAEALAAFKDYEAQCLK